MASQRIDHLNVVSPDPQMLAWVAQFGVHPILQPDQGLNAGLEYARRVALNRQRATSLLVVLPDLPYVAPADIAALTHLDADNTVVLAPDRHGHGTNALLIQPADALVFHFGVASLERHRAEAQAGGLAIREYHATGTAFDLDTADDLHHVDDLVGAGPLTDALPAGRKEDSHGDVHYPGDVDRQGPSRH
jgi:2-phospho-L-lactate/phosphoenolpyruvate guanylyltransferase